MQSLDLNLATRPFRNNTLIWISYLAGVLLLAGLTYLNIDRWQTYKAKYDEESATMTSFEDRMAQLKQRLKQARNEERKFDLKSLRIEADKANEVIEWKAFSWTRLFNKLEAAHPWNVRMMEIRPVFRGQRQGGGEVRMSGDEVNVPVVVEGMAKDLRALLEFQRNLFADPAFASPEPERYETTDTKELQFTMRFYYYPNREEEPEPEEGEAPAGEAVAEGQEGAAADAVAAIGEDA